LARIADLGCRCADCDDADARNRREALGELVLAMERDHQLFDGSEPRLKVFDLAGQDPQHIHCHGGNPRDGACQYPVDQPQGLMYAAGMICTELGQHRSDSVGELRPLPHEKVACPVNAKLGLFFG